MQSHFLGNFSGFLRLSSLILYETVPLVCPFRCPATVPRGNSSPTRLFHMLITIPQSKQFFKWIRSDVQVKGPLIPILIPRKILFTSHKFLLKCSPLSIILNFLLSIKRYLSHFLSIYALDLILRRAFVILNKHTTFQLYHCSFPSRISPSSPR